MKTLISKAISLLLVIFVLVAPAYAHNSIQTKDDISSNYIHDENVEEVIKSDAMLKAEMWIRENYNEYYKIRNLSIKQAESTKTKDEILLTLYIEFETCPIFTDTKETPLGKGLLEALEGIKLSLTEKNAIDNYFDALNADASFNEYSGVFIEIIASYNKKLGSWNLYYNNGFDEQLRNIDEIAIDKDNLYARGRETAKELLLSANSETQRGYSSYDRFEARKYARAWSSNPTACFDCGTSCGYMQNRSLWNNSTYPYDSGFKHNDCADFVSQAMSKGGLPELSGWYRTKYSPTLDSTLSWIRVDRLKKYMTETHTYWDVSTYSMCNAGNIVITNNGEHVVMVDRNDGVTAYFSGHTNDRKQQVLANNSSFEYYVINRN